MKELLLINITRANAEQKNRNDRITQEPQGEASREPDAPEILGNGPRDDTSIPYQGQNGRWGQVSQDPYQSQPALIDPALRDEPEGTLTVPSEDCRFPLGSKDEEPRSPTSDTILPEAHQSDGCLEK